MKYHGNVTHITYDTAMRIRRPRDTHGRRGAEQDREAGAGNDNNDNTEDKRWGIRCCNIIIVILGVFVGVCGLVYVIYELASGEAKADEV